MPETVTPEFFLIQRDNQIPLIDVRTPLEFNESHIPGAINIPIFSDEERAEVGTLYKQVNREAALLKALDYTGPKLSSFLKTINKITRKKELLLYCWRGGMRSNSMAWLFELGGYKTTILKDGYRAYRNYLKEIFGEDQKIIILGGMTGSGKSEILAHLETANEQIIDLEGIAHHKGSAFGALGQEVQPGNKQFENILGEKWRNLDRNKVVWLEDESAAIGKVSIPKEIYVKMRSSNVIRINRSKEERIKRLINEYSSFTKDQLAESVLKITKKLGGLNTGICLEAIDNEDYEKVVELTLHYYDKTYLSGIMKRNQNSVFNLSYNSNNSVSDILEFAKNNNLTN